MLGARCAVYGPWPYQWGLVDLFAQDEHCNWETVWPLISGDEELAKD